MRLLGLSGSPTRADDGVYDVEVTVTDGGGLSDTKVIQITLYII